MVCVYIPSIYVSYNAELVANLPSTFKVTRPTADGDGRSLSSYFSFFSLHHERRTEISSYTLMRCKYAKLVAAIHASSPLIKSRQIADRSKLKGVIIEMEISRALEHEYSAS